MLLALQVLEDLRRLLPSECVSFFFPLVATAVSTLTRRSVCAECDTFSRSSDAVFELSLRFAKPWEQDKSLSPEQALEAKRLMFHELTQICLWGNSTDLSLLINVSVALWARERLDLKLTGFVAQMTEEDIKKLQSTGGDHLAATEQNILGNDLGKVWEYISSKKFGTPEKGGRMDFVLDNAGFELYCDCVYADWLIQSGLCSEIRFHGKVRVSH